MAHAHPNDRASSRAWLRSVLDDDYDDADIDSIVGNDSEDGEDRDEGHSGEEDVDHDESHNGADDRDESHNGEEDKDRDDSLPTESRASSSDRGRPQSWSEETVRAYEAIVRIAFEKKHIPMSQGLKGATWKEIGQLVSLRGRPAKYGDFNRIEKLYDTPGALPSSLYQVYSECLVLAGRTPRTTRPADEAGTARRSGRVTALPTIDSKRDQAMMQYAIVAWIWLVHLAQPYRDEALAANVAGRLEFWSPGMVRRRLDYLTDIAKNSDHPHHEALNKHPELKKLVEKYVRIQEEDLNSALERFSNEHQDQVAGDEVSFTDVLLWGIQQTMPFDTMGRINDALCAKTVAFLRRALHGRAAVFSVDNITDRFRDLVHFWKSKKAADFLTRAQIRAIDSIHDEKKRMLKRPRNSADEEAKTREPESLARNDEHTNADSVGDDQAEEPSKRMRSTNTEPPRGSRVETTRSRFGSTKELPVRTPPQTAEPRTSEPADVIVIDDSDDEEPAEEALELDPMETDDDDNIPFDHDDREEAVLDASTTRVASSHMQDDESTEPVCRPLAAPKPQRSRAACDELHMESKSEEAPPGDDGGESDSDMDEVIGSTIDASPGRSSVITPVQEEPRAVAEPRMDPRVERMEPTKEEMMASIRQLVSIVDTMWGELDEQKHEYRSLKGQVATLATDIERQRSLFERLRQRTTRKEGMRQLGDVCRPDDFPPEN